MITPDEYQSLCQRTECDQNLSRGRMVGIINPQISSDPATNIPIRLNHAIIGMVGEVGELASALERWIYYGKQPDTVNFAEELGDLAWYLSEACNALGLSLSAVMEANIRKLRVRYPDKYEDVRAAEEGRDRDRERQVLEQQAILRDVGNILAAAKPIDAIRSLPCECLDHILPNCPYHNALKARIGMSQAEKSCPEKYHDGQEGVE